MNTEPKSKQLTCDLERLRDIANDIARLAHAPYCLELDGDLGGGKTTFIRFLAQTLGVTEPITSPTFTIHKSYSLPTGGTLEHFDLYRMDQMNDIVGDELADALSDQNAITVVEWAAHHNVKFPKHHMTIRLSFVDDNTRMVELIAGDSEFVQVAEQIK